MATAPQRKIRAPHIAAAAAILVLLALLAMFGRPLFPPRPDRAMPEAIGESPIAGPRAPLGGHLLDAAGAPIGGAMVRGCGGESATTADGAFAMEAIAGPCQLEPSIDVGPWRLIGVAPKVIAGSGPTAIDLRFEALHAVVVRPFDLRTDWLVSFGEDGLHVQMASEEMSARHGVYAGDRITAVDGVPLAGLDPIAQLRAAAALADGAPVLAVVH